MTYLSKLSAITSTLLSSTAKRRIAQRWMFRTHSRLFPAFARQHQMSIERDDNFSYLYVDGRPYVWPVTADLEPLRHLLAELLTPEHPHQYDYPPTQIEKKDVLLDIGCCDGGFAAKAAELGAAVIAVEPSEMMARVIQRLFALRGLPPPDIQRCLLGSAPGFAFFQENIHDPATSQIAATELPQSYRVPVTTIDLLTASLPSKPTYIKCDAEGADYDILLGGREYLEKFRPKIAVTTYHNTGDFDRITAYLQGIGYNTSGKGIMYVAGELRVVMIHAT